MSQPNPARVRYHGHHAHCPLHLCTVCKFLGLQFWNRIFTIKMWGDSRFILKDWYLWLQSESWIVSQNCQVYFGFKTLSFSRFSVLQRLMSKYQYNGGQALRHSLGIALVPGPNSTLWNWSKKFAGALDIAQPQLPSAGPSVVNRKWNRVVLTLVQHCENAPGKTPNLCCWNKLFTWGGSEIKEKTVRIFL